MNFDSAFFRVLFFSFLLSFAVIFFTQFASKCKCIAYFLKKRGFLAEWSLLVVSSNFDSRNCFCLSEIPRQLYGLLEKTMLNFWPRLSSCLLYPIMVIQSYIMFRNKIPIQKKLNNFLNQHVNVKVTSRFATFAISIVVNICLGYLG